MNGSFDHPVKVSVFSEKEYLGDWIPENVIEAINWLHGKLSEVPAQYRAKAEIVIDSVGDYDDCHSARIEIYYERPPTSEEIEKRKITFEQQRAYEIDWAERRLAQLRGQQ